MNSEHGHGFAEPGGGSERAAVPFTPPAQEQAAVPFAPDAQGPRSGVTSVLERHGEQLSKIQGVHGVAEGRTPIGDAAVLVYVDDDSVRGRVPREIEGYPVEVVVVPGGFDILPAGSPSTG